MRAKFPICGMVLAGATSAMMRADSFTNGGFESGSLSGWTQGGGYWTGGWPLKPTSYLPGGVNYNSEITRACLASSQAR